jgi:ADP-heptose:LPS heptosyltransferase
MSRPPAAADPQRILVIKLAGLGDLLTATPALRALRLRFPDAEICALVTPETASLLDGNDAVDQVIPFPKALYDRPSDLLRPRSGFPAARKAAGLGLALRRSRFDVAVLLHHLITPWGVAKYRALLAAAGAPNRVGLDDGRGSFLTHSVPDDGFGARHEVDYWLDVVSLLGAQNPNPRMELPITHAEKEDGSRWWRDHSLTPSQMAVLHPGSGTFSIARRWAPDRFAAVGDALQARGLDVVINAGPGEETLAGVVAGAMTGPSTILSGLDSPRKLAAVLQAARLFVGNDSGVMHIAAAMGVPVVGVFGLTNHRAWGPYPPEAHRVVRLDLACSPCFYRGHSMGTPEGCPPRMCLVDLDPNAVIAAAVDLLESSPAPAALN